MMKTATTNAAGRAIASRVPISGDVFFVLQERCKECNGDEHNERSADVPVQDRDAAIKKLTAINVRDEIHRAKCK